MNYNEETDQTPVDGFSDTEGPTDVDAPDQERSDAAPKPLSPEEYAKAQKEAREEE